MNRWRKRNILHNGELFYLFFLGSINIYDNMDATEGHVRRNKLDIKRQKPQDLTYIQKLNSWTQGSSVVVAIGFGWGKWQAKNKTFSVQQEK